jgi:hypothetical protein
VTTTAATLNLSGGGLIALRGHQVLEQLTVRLFPQSSSELSHSAIGSLSESHLYIAKTPPWRSKARSLAQDYRGVLSVCTKFPRAGEKTVEVEEFVDLCIAVREASGGIGERANWVIEVCAP